MRIDQATPDVRRDQYDIEGQTPGLGDNTPGYNDEDTPGLRKALRTDKKNKTELQMHGARTNRSNQINSTLNASIMSLMKKSTIQLKSKNSSVHHLKKAGQVST